MVKKKENISLNDKAIYLISKYFIFIFLAFVIIVFLFPYALSETKILKNVIGEEEPSKIGEALGGITAPIIGIFSALILYVAFYAQIKANEELRKLNARQLQIIEFQNIKILFDHIQAIDNNIIIYRQGSNEIESRGLKNVLKKIIFLSKKINNIISYDLGKNIKIIEIDNLKKYIDIYTNKVKESELDELEKDFLIKGIEDYYIDELLFKHYNYENYKSQLDNLDKNILARNKSTFNNRIDRLDSTIRKLLEFNHYKQLSKET